MDNRSYLDATPKMDHSFVSMTGMDKSPIMPKHSLDTAAKADFADVLDDLDYEEKTMTDELLSNLEKSKVVPQVMQMCIQD